jgi:hypothetical protein
MQRAAISAVVLKKSQKFRLNITGALPPFIAWLLFVSIGMLYLNGCKTAEETEAKETISYKEFLATSEKDFNPSDYDKTVEAIKREASGKTLEGTGAKKISEAVSDTVQGFRVQVLFSQEIEIATALRDTLNTLLPEEYVYIVYEQPYYKVRIGNYTDRVAANNMLRQIIGKGYNDAWVVPDNVLTNLPPKPQPAPLEQKQE